MKKVVLILSMLTAFAALLPAQDLYNLSMDDWSKDGKVWYPRAQNATDSQKVWDTGNKGTIVLGKNVTEPEEEFVAVPGPGKRAARLRSEFIGILGIGKFASACLYTGKFNKVQGMEGASFYFGVPSSRRPKSLHGYYAFKPGKINYAAKSKASLKGTMDHGHIEVYVATWKEPFLIDNTKGLGLDPNSPEVIGYGVLDLSTATDGYVEFDIPVVYKNEKTPTYFGIMAASSKWGDVFTGSTDSILYLDELEVRY